MPHEPLVQRAVRSFDGTELAAYASPMPRAGAGTILLIGPPGAGAVAWRHQSHYFAPRYRIVTWDWRGLGSSRRPSDPSALDVADQARDAAAVLADAGAPHAAMLAWGEGAQVALDIAHRAPTIPSHLVLICPRWGATFGRKLGMPTAGWVAPLTRALEPAARRLARWPEAAAWTIRLGLAAQALDAELFAEIAARGAELDPETLAATSRGLSRHVDAPMPESITMPTLMVAGTRDRVTPPELARRLARRLPFGELFVVEDASGWAPLEYPELINLRIEKFLDQTGFA